MKFQILQISLVVLISLFSNGIRCQNQNCPQSILDIAFLVDSSGSVDLIDFEKAKSAVGTIVSKLKVDPAKVHVGLMTFSSSDTVTQGLVASEQTMAFVLQKIKQLPYFGDGTNTAGALISARTKIFGKPRQQAIPRVAVVITDGYSNDYTSTIREANNLRAAGIEIYAIGIGNYYKLELEGISSGPEYILELSNFNQLMAAVNAITQSVCLTPAFVDVRTPVESNAEKNEHRYYQTLLPSNTNMVELEVTNVKGSSLVYASTTEKNPQAHNSRALKSRKVKDANGYYADTQWLEVEAKDTKLYFSVEGLETVNEYVIKVIPISLPPIG